ncbi:putative lipoate-protein ligase b [Diplodia seriata]|uniref:Octanoyltransferase n=1 Tax=Diplodia seriata TaxID=420778 RepID=A0A0G2EI07_9PEZI|nr:putative lipoate-protein ligase b [Diplodia seriata]
MRLGHLHLSRPQRIWPYQRVAALQDQAVARYLAAKARPDLPPPNPTIITAEFHPVYTCGRREVGTVDAKQQDYLRANGEADFVEALRGGQTTFHGPGQLVAYPIIDLKRHRITPRDYVCVLEKTVIQTCAAYGIKATTTEHTGVWTTPDKKICALGLHMRRNITSHGIGLNVNTDLKWFDRIVACGLEGKRTTSFESEGVVGKTVEEVARLFAQNLSERLRTADVDEMNNEEDYLHYLDTK